jgi:hypothetical protein
MGIIWLGGNQHLNVRAKTFEDKISLLALGLSAKLVQIIILKESMDENEFGIF